MKAPGVKARGFSCAKKEAAFGGRRDFFPSAAKAAPTLRLLRLEFFDGLIGGGMLFPLLASPAEQHGIDRKSSSSQK